jgi:hypothetical protein
MNTLEVNANTLAVLYEQSPQSFEGITLDQNLLKYNGEEVDISSFNINDLLADNNNFASSLGNLAPEDVFKIIRLHATLLSGSSITRGPAKDGEDESQKKIETIKQENPLMRNISIVKKNDQGIKREYINIVDSTGKDHLFPNDRNVNVFDIYDLLKLQYGDSVTPDQLIEAVYRKLYDVRLNTAENLMDKESTSEEFSNKLERVNDPYRHDKNVDVVASEEHDIAIIADKNDPGNHRVVTFDQNEFGDLVVNQHEQNVVGTDTISRTTTDSSVVGSTSGVDETVENENQVFEKDEENIEALLIKTKEFYDLLNSPEQLTEEQRNSVNLYYGYLGDLIIYEDYLVPELRKMLNDFRAYVFELQYGDVHVPLNEKQREAIDKLEEMQQVEALEQDNLSPDKIDDSVKKLQRIRPVDNYNRQDEDNAGMVSTVQVIAFIIGIAIILTAITLYLLS